MVAFAERLAQQLDRIEADNERINALLYVRPRDELLAEAKRIDAKIAKGDAGRLAGLSIAIKANINKTGFPTNCASRTLEGYAAAYDADVVARIEAEDGLIIGVANCDEFACGASGTHSAFGATKNPRDETRISGGSSSGSAASVAAGFCDAALGTDTGGSVRNPASHCGVVGIKPSYGRVSRHGVVDLSMSLDQVAPIARDVETALRVLNVIAGFSENDATTYEAPVPDLAKDPKSELRFAVLDLSPFSISKDVTGVFDARIAELESSIGKLPRVSIDSIGLAVATYYPLVYTEFFSATRRFDGRRYGKPIDEAGGDEVKRRILAGKRIALAEDENRFYRKALVVKERIAESFTEAFEDVDVILSPVVPVPARLITDDILPEDEYAEDALTIPANLAGICGASLPAGDAKGLPVGIQLLAPRLREDILAAAMRLVEKR